MTAKTKAVLCFAVSLASIAAATLFSTYDYPAWQHAVTTAAWASGAATWAAAGGRFMSNHRTESRQP